MKCASLLSTLFGASAATESYPYAFARASQAANPIPIHIIEEAPSASMNFLQQKASTPVVNVVMGGSGHAALALDKEPAAMTSKLTGLRASEFALRDRLLSGHAFLQNAGEDNTVINLHVAEGAMSEEMVQEVEKSLIAQRKTIVDKLLQRHAVLEGLQQKGAFLESQDASVPTVQLRLIPSHAAMQKQLNRAEKAIDAAAAEQLETFVQGITHAGRSVHKAFLELAGRPTSLQIQVAGTSAASANTMALLKHTASLPEEYMTDIMRTSSEALKQATERLNKSIIKENMKSNKAFLEENFEEFDISVGSAGRSANMVKEVETALAQQHIALSKMRVEALSLLHKFEEDAKSFVMTELSQHA